MAYEILPHTADLKIRARGATREEFLNSALAGVFAAAGARYSDNQEAARRSFRVEAADWNSLIVDFLNEAIALADENAEVLSEARFSALTDRLAEGEFVGRSVRGFDTEIKAATHYELCVETDERGNLVGTITFDV